MTKNNLTFVTCLFDIGRGNLESGFKRDFSHYKECFARLLEIKYPLVIFTTPDLEEFIWQHRSRDNTRIVFKTLDDLRSFPFYKQIQQIRVTPEWINQSAWIVDSTQAKLELYNCITMSKQFMLNDSTLFNFFNTKYFLFIDAAISNTIGNVTGYINDDFEAKVIPHLNKMMYLGFPYQADAPEVHGFTKSKLNQLAGTVTEYVCRGGLFGGSKEFINAINDIYYHLLNSTITEGYMGTEESIFTIIAHLHKDKVNVNMIESNGLIYKFLENLQNSQLPKIKQYPLAFYFLTFNTPKQFEYTLEKWKAAYPETFNTVKKYVVNNSNDSSINDEYQKLFKDNNIEEFKFDNIGINSARRFVAEHFDKSDHDYYVFIEEDMGVYTSNVDPSTFKPETCKNGFQTFKDGLFQNALEIVKSENLDFLKLTFTEFFGDNFCDWGYINAPPDKKEVYFPPKSDYLSTKSYSPKTLNKPKIKYLGVYHDLPFAVGSFHIDNWPIICSKEGSRKVYLDIKWKFEYEQTFMSLARDLWEQGKIEIGCLLASPILHNRIYHYDGSKRRENETYTN